MANLSDAVRAQSIWREEKAQQFPQDQRNAQSARALHSLAEFIESGAAEALSPGVLASLEPHMSARGAVLGRRRTGHALSRYGMGYEAITAVKHADLYVTCMADAYLHAGGTGTDRTGALYPFEVSAALERVHLPDPYWRGRPGRTEAECRAEVAAYSAAPVAETTTA